VVKAINFDGKAMEYFGIWIANIVLNVVTVGIFSAWAKVRKLRYFYNNTKILGNSMSYHASGWQILKGRAIAFFAVLFYASLSYFWPMLNGIGFFIILILLPWIINSSLRFSSRMISYRNIRFNWHGSYGKTLLYFVIGPVISFVSVGLLHPLFTKYYYTYYAENHSYGTSRFNSKNSVKSFYIASIRSGLMPCLCLFYGLVIFFLWHARDLFGEFGESYSENSTVHLDLIEHFYYVFPEWAGVVVLALFPLIFITNVIYRIAARNLLLRALVLNEDREEEVSAKFDSTLNPFVYIWIVITNSIIVPLTLGLMSPWAQIRFYRYFCRSTKMEVTGNLDLFVDSEKKKLSSLGQEYAEMEGFEVNI